MECEIRFRYDAETLRKLMGLKPTLVSSYRSIDEYFAYKSHKNSTFVIRFRNKGKKCILAFKTEKTKMIWHEWENEIKEPTVLKRLLIAAGFKKFLVIDKIRKQYSYAGFEINVDNIKGLGKFIEIEIISNTKNSGKAKDMLYSIAMNKLGISKDKIIEKGYVRLMSD